MPQAISHFLMLEFLPYDDFDLRLQAIGVHGDAIPIDPTIWAARSAEILDISKDRARTAPARIEQTKAEMTCLRTLGFQATPTSPSKGSEAAASHLQLLTPLFKPILNQVVS